MSLICNKCGGTDFDIRVAGQKSKNPGKTYYKCNGCGNFCGWEEPEMPGTKEKPPKEKNNLPKDYHKDELNTRLNNCLICATEIAKKQMGVTPQLVLENTFILYNGCEQIKQGIYKK